MNHHKNVHLTVLGRQLLVGRVLEQGLRVEEADHAAESLSEQLTSGSLDIVRRDLMACSVTLLAPMPSMTSANRDYRTAQASTNLSTHQSWAGGASLRVNVNHHAASIVPSGVSHRSHPSLAAKRKN